MQPSALLDILVHISCILHDHTHTSYCSALCKLLGLPPQLWKYWSG